MQSRFNSYLPLTIGVSVVGLYASSRFKYAKKRARGEVALKNRFIKMKLPTAQDIKKVFHSLSDQSIKVDHTLVGIRVNFNENSAKGLTKLSGEFEALEKGRVVLNLVTNSLILMGAGYDSLRTCELYENLSPSVLPLEYVEKLVDLEKEIDSIQVVGYSHIFVLGNPDDHIPIKDEMQGHLQKAKICSTYVSFKPHILNVSKHESADEATDVKSESQRQIYGAMLTEAAATDLVRKVWVEVLTDFLFGQSKVVEKFVPKKDPDYPYTRIGVDGLLSFSRFIEKRLMDEEMQLDITPAPRM